MDFSFWHVLQTKVWVIPFANLDALHLSIAAEWYQLMAEFACKACRSFCPAGKPLLTKI
jgi:hypothetical protein